MTVHNKIRNMLEAYFYQDMLHSSSNKKVRVVVLLCIMDTGQIFYSTSCELDKEGCAV